MIEIWEDKEIKQKYFLKLSNDSEGDIVLHIVDEKGNGIKDGNILFIRENQGLQFAELIDKSVAEQMGIVLDESFGINVVDDFY